MDSFNDKFANKPVLQMKNIVEVLRSLPAMPQPEVYGGGMQHNHHPHALAGQLMGQPMGQPVAMAQPV